MLNVPVYFQHVVRKSLSKLKFFVWKFFLNSQGSQLVYKKKYQHTFGWVDTSIIVEDALSGEWTSGHHIKRGNYLLNAVNLHLFGYYKA